MIVKDATTGNLMESENALVVAQWKKYADRYIDQGNKRGKSAKSDAQAEVSSNQ